MKVKLSSLKVDNTIEGNVLNDSNGNNIAETYFPKSGGELKGNIIKRNEKPTNTLRLYSCTRDTNGAFLHLFGPENNDEVSFHTGDFVLGAVDNTYRSLLAGHADGRLIWNAKVNNTEQKLIGDLGGSAIVAKSVGSMGYIKYVSGLIIAYRKLWVDSGTQKWTFPISFSSEPVVLCTPLIYGTQPTISIDYTNISKDNVVFSSSRDGYIELLAIGH